MFGFRTPTRAVDGSTSAMSGRMPQEIVGVASFASFASTTSEEQSLASLKHNQPPKEDEGKGWFDDWEFADIADDDDDNDDGGCKTPKLAAKERELWIKFVSSLSPPTTSAVAGSLLGLLQASLDDEGDMEELYLYRNPAPSQSFKQSSESIGACLKLSVYISGFRIVQRVSTGEIFAQFRFNYCYGSQAHVSWRSYSEFRELASVLHYAQSNVSDKLFVASLRVWAYIEHKKTTFRNLSITYLVEKSVYLNKFVESILYESATPALLLYFAHSSRFVAV